MTKKIRLSNIHLQGIVIEGSFIHLDGSGEDRFHSHRSYYYVNHDLIKQGAMRETDELIEILTDRKHDRIELRKATYIMEDAMVDLTYAIQVKKA